MKINIHFWIFLNISIIASLCDIIGYTTKIPYEICVILSLILLGIINLILIKRKLIKIQSDFEFLDITFYFMIFLMMLLRLPIPDFSYDVSNYHIYLQENTYIDKINFDFFAGKTVNGFLFPLGDKMHYLFRHFLGYRLGTILSYYVIIVLFYQTKNILKLVCGDKKIIPIISILCFSSYIIRQWTGTYYIDNFCIVLILEIVHQMLIDKKCFENKKTIYLIALISGIATAIKITNIILILPIIICFMIKRRKQLTTSIIPVFIVSGIIVLIPSLIYIIDNMIQTGSPLFPYYNSIFKSEYFGLFSWKDSRFGIPNVLYALIWPIYVSCIKLGYGDNWLITDYIWAVGYIVTISYIIYSKFIKKNKNDLICNISILSLVLTLVWICFLEGYMRYALIIPVLYSIVLGAILIKLFSKLKIETNILDFFLFKILFPTILGLCIIFAAFNLNVRVLENYKLIYKDRKDISLHIDGVWGVIADDSSITQLLREKQTPIYNLEESINTSDITQKMYYSKMKNNNIYVLIDDYKYARKIYYLNVNGFHITEEVRSLYIR